MAELLRLHKRRDAQILRVRPETLALTRQALDDIRDMHEVPQFPDRKYYHNRRHTLAVIRRTLRVVDIANDISPEHITAGIFDAAYIAPAYHDYYQQYLAFHYPGQEYFDKRVRYAWINEIRSAVKAIDAVQRVSDNEDVLFYDYEFMKMIGEAIEVTTPGWDDKNHTVYQPGLDENSSLLSRAIAMADINSAAFDGCRVAQKEADRLLVEDNLGLAGYLLDLPGYRDYLDEDKATRLIIDWTKFQVQYLQGRKSRVNIELAGLPPVMMRHLRDDFLIRLDESIAYMKLIADQRAVMGPGQLFAEFTPILR